MQVLVALTTDNTWLSGFLIKLSGHIPDSVAWVNLSVELLSDLIKDLLPGLELLIPLRNFIGILIDLHAVHIPTLTQLHLPLPNQLGSVLHIHDPRAGRSRIFGVFVDTHVEFPAGSEEEFRICRKRISKRAFGALEWLHSSLHIVLNEQNGAFGENVGGDLLVQRKRDVVRRELNVGGVNEDVVNVKVGGGTVEVEGHATGWVAGVAVAASERAVFDDSGEGDEDVGGYFRSECRVY